MKTLSLMSMAFFSLAIAVQSYSQTENSAVISVNNMNVFYRGIDNPISIAVPGIASDKIKVSITNGTISGRNGKYVVSVDKGTETVIDVSTEPKPGENKKVGSYAFRILRIPAPSVNLGNIHPDCERLDMTQDELIKNTELKISWDLPLDLKFEVKSFVFTVIINGDGQTVKVVGNQFNEEIKKIINNIRAGSKIIIDDIIVSGPGGTRTLPGLSILVVDKE
jgi:gliding motility-associated protein GldM